MGKAHLLAVDKIDHTATDGTGLREKTNAAHIGGAADEGGVEAVDQVHGAHTIGADETHFVLVGNFQALLLQVLTGGTDFFETT
ncbi:hypothetical protein SDC9_169970 [bioreactor metagenome]|uniref:Uncharacterized protein n=1 Tax=bioreactor metagenome TaxID=1076179 RepID=A0A645G6S0_9ZZZZ